MALLKLWTDHNFLLETVDFRIDMKLKEKQKYALCKTTAHILMCKVLLSTKTSTTLSLYYLMPV